MMPWERDGEVGDNGEGGGEEKEDTEEEDASDHYVDNAIDKDGDIDDSDDNDENDKDLTRADSYQSPYARDRSTFLTSGDEETIEQGE